MRKETLYAVLALVGYGFLLVPLGFIITTFVVFVFLFRFAVDQKWLVALVGGLILALGAYVIFNTLLRVPLPRGILVI